MFLVSKAVISSILMVVPLMPVTVMLTGGPLYAQAEEAAAAEEPLPPEMPLLLYPHSGVGRELPVFVSPEIAVDSRGKLVESYFHPDIAEYLESVLRGDEAQNASGCREYTVESQTVTSRTSNVDLGEAIRFADVILFGQIIDLTQGFGTTGPVTLYQVRVEELYKGFLNEPISYFVLPRADIIVAGTEICRSDSRTQPLLRGQNLFILGDSSAPGDPYLRIVFEEADLVSPEELHVALPESLAKRKEADRAKFRWIVDGVLNGGEVSETLAPVVAEVPN